jgi:hypothetical protein
MNDSDIEDRPDLNASKEWSEMDLFDLANGVRLNSRSKKSRVSCADPGAKCARRSQSQSRPANSPGPSKKPPPALSWNRRSGRGPDRAPAALTRSCLARTTFPGGNPEAILMSLPAQGRLALE